MYQDVQASPRAGLSPLVEGWAPIRSIQAIERTVMRLYQAYEAWREQRTAIRALQELDDHLLQDLDIQRRDIPRIVARQAAAGRR